ncbi:MAG: hypothetical protein LBI82_05715 [Dysgonamonadaceae bacterium]|jgi:hypothetical protein|nr:hypothetical protein [Dysgonamonadaceae bacterium]
MKATNEQLITAIESAISEGLSRFETQHSVETLSDLYLYFDEENLDLIVHDDVENQLISVELDYFNGSSELSHEEEFLEAAKIATERLNKAGLFDKDYILKPFSVSLVDSDFIVSEELIFIDDETLKLNDGLLAGLDKELNDFLKELMK